MGAIDTLRLIATALKYAYRILIFFLTRCGDRRFLVHHILPFRIKVNKSGEVGFPRLQIIVVHVAIGVIIVVLIGQARETMTELMYDNIARKAVAAGTRAIKVVDSASTVFLRVDKDINLVVWHLSRQITYVAVVGAHAVAFRVKGPEAEAHYGVLVDMIAWHGATTFGRRSHNTTDVKALTVAVIRCIAEHALHKEIAILDEFAHLGLGITFRKDDNVDSLGNVLVTNPSLIDGQIELVVVADEVVIRAHGKAHTLLELAFPGFIA